MKNPIDHVKKMMMHKAHMTDNHCMYHFKQPLHMNKRSDRHMKHGGKM